MGRMKGPGLFLAQFAGTAGCRTRNRAMLGLGGAV